MAWKLKEWLENVSVFNQEAAENIESGIGEDKTKAEEAATKATEAKTLAQEAKTLAEGAKGESVTTISGGSLAAGEEALEALKAVAKAEQEAHQASNTAFGFKALKALKAARKDASPNFTARNTAFGSEALAANDKGIWNVAVGAKVLGNLKIGTATAKEEEEAGNEIKEGEFEAKITSGSTELTAVTSFTNVSIGQELTSAGKLEANTKVESYDSTAKTIIMTKKAEASGSSQKVKVSGSLGYAAGFNTAIGTRCAPELLLGQHNVFIGANVLQEGIYGSQNTCVGCNTLERATGKVNNVTAIGISALEQLEGGGSPTDGATVAIGANAGARLAHVWESVIIGDEAHRNGKQSHQDVIIGEDACGGSAALTHEGNTSAITCVGAFALGSLTEGEKSVAIGYGSQASSTNTPNVSIGYHSLYKNSTGSKNLAIGSESGQGNETGKENVWLGPESGENAHAASKAIVAIGWKALGSAAEGRSVAIGYSSQKVATGWPNISVGYLAMNETTTGAKNTGIGTEALRKLSTGEKNTVIGHEAGEVVSTSSGNNLYGYQAAHKLTTGAKNLAFGNEAGSGLTTGTENTFVGNEAGVNAHSEGKALVGIGYKALGSAAEGRSVAVGYSSQSKATGWPNVSMGYLSMNELTTGARNTAVGSESLKKTSTGSKNVAVGHEAGEENLTGEENVFLGNAAGKKETGSKKLYIAASETTEPLIKGEFPNTTLSLNATKIGFFKVAAVEQPKTTGTSTGFAEGTGTAVKSVSTFTGNKGSTAYTIGDIVLALKELGLLKE